VEAVQTIHAQEQAEAQVVVRQAVSLAAQQELVTRVLILQ
jgi:hypothetical protein